MNSMKSFFAACALAAMGTLMCAACGDESGNASQTSKTEEKAVDLGLPSGTKWATANVGAASPEDCGDYFAWGETSPKSEYESRTYAHLDTLSGAWGNIGSDIAGTEYDVATAKCGDDWRMPSQAQMEELVDCCTWTWVLYKGTHGYLVTGQNGSSIFLPAAGYKEGKILHEAGIRGSYWTSTACGDGGVGSAMAVDISVNGVGTDLEGDRCTGMTVRPVAK